MSNKVLSVLILIGLILGYIGIRLLYTYIKNKTVTKSDIKTGVGRVIKFFNNLGYVPSNSKGGAKSDSLYYRINNEHPTLEERSRYGATFRDEQGNIFRANGEKIDKAAEEIKMLNRK